VIHYEDMALQNKASIGKLHLVRAWVCKPQATPALHRTGATVLAKHKLQS